MRHWMPEKNDFRGHLVLAVELEHPGELLDARLCPRDAAPAELDGREAPAAVLARLDGAVLSDVPEPRLLSAGEPLSARRIELRPERRDRLVEPRIERQLPAGEAALDVDRRPFRLRARRGLLTRRQVRRPRSERCLTRSAAGRDENNGDGGEPNPQLSSRTAPRG